MDLNQDDLNASIDIEYKICRICVQANVEDNYPQSELYDEVSVETMLKEVMEKLQVPDDENLAVRCCSSCREELWITHRFIRKLEDANNKIKNLEHYVVDADKSDPLTEAPSKSNIDIKLEDEEEDHSTYEPDVTNAFEETDSDDKPLIQRRVRRKPGRKRKKLKTDPEDSDDSEYSPRKEDNSISESEDQELTKNKRVRYAITANSQPKRCCGCKEPVSTHEQLEEHSVKFHQRRAIDPEVIEQKPEECSICYERFETRMEHLLHRRKAFAKELHACKKCPADFANAYNLRVHLKNNHKREKIVKQIDEIRQKVHICCKCHKQFDTKELMVEHGNAEHKIKHPPDTENQVECEVCHRRFKSEHVLTEHQRRPYRAHRYQCAHCGKTFQEKQVFLDHEQSHANIRPYQCHMCPKSFSLKTNYVTHIKYHSLPNDYFKCDKCGKGFKKKHLWQDHQIIHIESAERPFKCHLCPNTFTRQQLLDFHVKAHLGAKPFKCTKCTSSYIHERDLRRHVRAKHEPIVPFVCEICSKEFHRKDAYTKHLKTHEEEPETKKFGLV